MLFQKEQLQSPLLPISFQLNLLFSNTEILEKKAFKFYFNQFYCGIFFNNFLKHSLTIYHQIELLPGMHQGVCLIPGTKAKCPSTHLCNSSYLRLKQETPEPRYSGTNVCKVILVHRLPQRRGTMCQRRDFFIFYCIFICSNYIITVKSIHYPMYYIANIKEQHKETSQG